MKSSEPLRSEPADSTPDFGPTHRGGAFALFVAVFCAFSAAGAALLLWREGLTVWAGLTALFFGAAAAWAIWHLVERSRYHDPVPRSHAVLTKVLGFDLSCTCRDVAATVFFEPDTLTPASSTRLFCFLENYASRRRVARFRFGPHAALGLGEAKDVPLYLAAGQAAVFVLPLTLASTLTPGEHDLPVTLEVDRPTGTGLRLPGIRGHLYDLWTVHFAAPFSVAGGPDGSAASNLSPPAAQYRSLASISHPQTQVEILNVLFPEVQERNRAYA